MEIHVVKMGDTVNSIAQQYGVSYQRLIFDNQIANPNRLIIGQSIVILFPEIMHTVNQGESLYTIAGYYNVSVLDIVRNNPYLISSRSLNVGQTIVIKYTDQKLGNTIINGYAYPYINKNTLDETLPYISALSVFSYGFTSQGNLIPINDNYLISKAHEYGVDPILVLTPFDNTGMFNNYLVKIITNDNVARQRLIQNLLIVVRDKGYAGVDVDFEYILPEDKVAYANFVGELTKSMNAEGYRVSVALAPKVSSAQAGLLYEGMDYPKLGQSANSVLLMTYEWGYTYGPPMAVAPINKVKEVLDYAVTQIPNEKIDMGIPNYGYDWALPFTRGVTKARLIGNVEALEIAARNNAEIHFDTTAMSPYFEYSLNGTEHVVWFEDARSIDAKLRTISQYNLRGAGYWNLMRYFRQNWLTANYLFNIISE